LALDGIDIEDIKRLKNFTSIEEIMGFAKNINEKPVEPEPGKKAEGCDACSS
jgi:hypothetical protein